MNKKLLIYTLLYLFIGKNIVTWHDNVGRLCLIPCSMLAYALIQNDQVYTQEDIVAFLNKDVIEERPLQYIQNKEHVQQEHEDAPVLEDLRSEEERIIDHFNATFKQELLEQKRQEIIRAKRKRSDYKNIPVRYSDE